jgi:hypothetical protein
MGWLAMSAPGGSSGRVLDRKRMVLEGALQDASSSGTVAGRSAARSSATDGGGTWFAVRVSKDIRAAIVGAPKYFKTYPRPKTPTDLRIHRCINFRHGSSSGVYRWEFDKGTRATREAHDRAPARRTNSIISSRDGPAGGRGDTRSSLNRASIRRFS